MSTRIDAKWSHRGLTVALTEGEILHSDVLPILRGTISDLVCEPTQPNLLWHNLPCLLSGLTRRRASTIRRPLGAPPVRWKRTVAR